MSGKELRGFKRNGVERGQRVGGRTEQRRTKQNEEREERIKRNIEGGEANSVMIGLVAAIKKSGPWRLLFCVSGVPACPPLPICCLDVYLFFLFFPSTVLPLMGVRTYLTTCV